MGVTCCEQNRKKIQKEKELLERKKREEEIQKEKELLERKKREEDNVKITQRKEIFSSRLDNINNLLKQISLIINIYSNAMLNCQNIIELINKKETNFSNLQNIFMANDIYNVKNNLNFLKEKKDKLGKHTNFLTHKINQLNQLINNYQLFQRNNNISYINFLNDKIYHDKINDIKVLENEMIDKINNNKNINGNLIISKINLEIKNLIDFPYFIIGDSFYNTKSRIDITYNKFLDEEKKIVTEILNKNKRKIIDYISNNDKLSSISDIKDRIIEQIITNEETFNYMVEKILKQIEEIAGNDEECKINNLNILLVGRKGVGKTTLIKYILGSLCHCESIDDNDFLIYTSQEINYLKIIEVKGIGYDSDCTPDNIYAKINNYINKKRNDNNGDYNNIIHCIWYCVSGARFEGGEKKLFDNLQKVYKDNTMPIIFVFTQTAISSIAEGMENNLRGKNIYNEFVQVLAQDIDLNDGDKNESFGKDELYKITLQKCTEALKSDMLNIMIREISKKVEKKLIKENEKIKVKILNETKNDFIQNFKIVLNDGDFILYITNIFVEHLKYFYDNNRKIKNRNKNLFFKSDFILSIKNIYESYKNGIKDIITPIIKDKSKELINIQSNFEKEHGNMNILNRRNLKEFKKITEIFLKQNYYYIVQNYIINFLIREKENNYLNVFLSLVTEKLKLLIESMTNLQNTNKEGTIIRKQLEYCFKLKLKSFIDINHINIEIDINDGHYKLYNKWKNNASDENFENPFKNSNSFIFYKSKTTNYNFIKESKIDTKMLTFGDNEWKLLRPDIKEKIRKFIEEFNYQTSSIKFNKEDHTFNFLQNELKKDLINFLDNNFSQYSNQIYFFLNNINSITYFGDNEIEQIIRNENIESFYENEIKNSLFKYSQTKNSIRLEHISVIVAGKAGVGKSALINCLLKLKGKESAPEGVGDVVTLETLSYTSKILTFLNLTDTRGYEIEREKEKEKFNPKNQKDEVIKNIKEKKEINFFGKILNFIIGKKNNENNKFNNYFHCIWFCVEGDDIDNSEENALKDLINESNIPVIVVNTRAIDENKVKLMKNKIKNLFPNLKFIHVLARDVEIKLSKKNKKKTKDAPEKVKIMKNFGLDELLNLTIDTIKSMETNDIFNSVKNEYKTMEENRIPKMISDIENNNINKIVETFINNYTHVLNEFEYEQYIFGLFEKFIMGFSFRENISQNTKLLLFENKIKNFIQKYISFYRKLSENYLSNILESKAFTFLDMQVKIEKEKNTSIIPKYKRNKDEFKELIFKFYNDNFCYFAQKYFIYRIIKDILEPLSENIGQILIKSLINFLSSKEIMKSYRNIYLKVFSDFEAEIDKFRDNNGKIYN